MPTSSTPYGTTQPWIPGLNRSQRNRYPGTVKTFDTVADLATAVVVERANIGMSLPVWYHRETIVVLDEPEGVERRWTLTSLGATSHARRVLIDTYAVELGADSNRVRGTTGAPISAVGADGDLAWDAAARTVYLRAGGTWAVAAVLDAEFTPVAVSGPTYTVQATDRNLDFAGDVACTVTVPDNLPSSKQISYLVTGTGIITFVKEDESPMPSTRGENTAPAGSCGAIVGTSTPGVFWLLNGSP